MSARRSLLGSESAIFPYIAGFSACSKNLSYAQHRVSFSNTPSTFGGCRYNGGMETFFFPLLWLIPDFEAEACGDSPFRVVKRKWDVSIFDIYSLVAEKHPLQLPAELMHLFLQQVNLEVEVTATDFMSAADRLDCFRAMLYLRGTSPIVAPLACNMSINAYAGINDRSSGRTHVMHDGLREGITHQTARIHTWANELSFSCIGVHEKNFTLNIGAGMVAGVISDSEKWLALENEHGTLRAARRALIKAPLMPDLGSSILQIWQGIEGLFPSINTEVTFRTSLLLAELLSPLNSRRATYDTSKKSYGDRSRIAHGSQKAVSLEQWLRAWLLLRDAIQSVILRRSLPDEDELTGELLIGGGWEA
jgi:hypothetical protein